MKTYLLLNQQKKVVFDIIRAAGFDPAQFSWTVIENNRFGGNPQINKLIYLGTQYYFTFDIDVTPTRISQYCPGERSFVKFKKYQDIEAQLSGITAWLKCLKAELDTPDPWEEIRKFYTFIGAPDFDGTKDMPFSVGEYEIVRGLLEDLRVSLSQIDRNFMDHQEFVNQQLALLGESAKKNGKRSFFYMLMGVLMHFSNRLDIDLDQMKPIWIMCREKIVGIIPFLPHP